MVECKKMYGFGEVTKHLRNQKRAARASWDSRQWIMWIPGCLVSDLGDVGEALADESGDGTPVDDFMVFCTQGRRLQVGWTPSDEDLSAMDWVVL